MVITTCFKRPGSAICNCRQITFISIGNDLHHILTQAGAYVKDVEAIAPKNGTVWARRPTALL